MKKKIKISKDLECPKIIEWNFYNSTTELKLNT